VGGVVLFAALCSTVAGGCRRARIRGRPDGAVVVVAARPVDDSSIPLADEVEPNNTLAAAQTLVFTDDPRTAGVSGTLPLGAAGSPADTDIFKIVVPAAPLAVPDGGLADARVPAPSPSGDAGAPPDRRLIVDLRPQEDLAVALQVLDAAGRKIEGSDAESGQPDGFPNIAVTVGGTYFLRLRPVPGAAARSVRSVPDGGTPRVGYRLVARVVDFGIGEEHEPNDRAAQATDLGPAVGNPEAAGFFGWRKDEDWYRLPLDGLPPGAVVDLEIDAVEGVSGGLALHDGAGTRISGTRGRRGERVALRNLAVPGGPASPAAGRGRSYYIVVRTEAGRSLDRRYGLHVHAGLAQEGTETEPNDEPGRASAISDGATTGFLGAGDVDVYRYVPALPVALDIEVTPPEGLNVKIEVLRARDGQSLASGGGAGRGQAERLTGIPVAEPVFIRLSPRRGEGSQAAPYELRLSSHPPTAAPGAPP
jgi:hypothetical protein